MNIPLLLRTVCRLRGSQIAYQLLNRLWRPRMREVPCTQGAGGTVFPGFIAKPACLSAGGAFTFLNLPGEFSSWSDTSRGMLWAYNLNYMDWLLQEGMSLAEGAAWIDRFIDGLPRNAVGLDPYPTALRTINWIKFISRHAGDIPQQRLDAWNGSLYSQCLLLARRPERHLGGNHLLEDAFSLFIAAIYFHDGRLYRMSARLLRRELEEQVLPDGAHYEQSPMYHCILLDRLLDCCNFSAANPRFEGQEAFVSFLRAKARRMLGHLGSIVYADGSLPLFNDSAEGIAPAPAELFAYADRLHIGWEATKMKECGYRRYTSGRMEATIDAGNIAASHQPGHSHADTFSYELRADGRPLVVDTGISTYDKNPRRQFERGTEAHNTVTAGGRNSSEVWGGFRMGRRARVRITSETERSMEAAHNGFGRRIRHARRFSMGEGFFKVTDSLPASCEGVSRIHFAPDVRVLSCGAKEIVTDRARVSLCGAVEVAMKDGKVASRYNTLLPAKVACARFRGEMTYRISL